MSRQDREKAAQVAANELSLCITGAVDGHISQAQARNTIDAILDAMLVTLREETRRRSDLHALDLEEYAQADTQVTGADGSPIKVTYDGAPATKDVTQEEWTDMTDMFPDGRTNTCSECGAELVVDTDGVSIVCPVHGSAWLPPAMAHAIYGAGAPATQTVRRKVNVPVMPILSIISAIDVACGDNDWDSLSAELQDAVAWAGSLLTNDSRVFGVTLGRMARGNIAKLLERVRTAEMIENGQDLSGEMYSTEGSIYAGTLDVTQ